MFQQPDRLSFHQANNHVAQDGAHGIKPLVGCTNVAETCIIQEDFLYDEDGHSFGQFAARFHDAQAERNDFGGQEECDGGRGVVGISGRAWSAGRVHRNTGGRLIFDQGADDAQ